MGNVFHIDKDNNLRRGKLRLLLVADEIPDHTRQPDYWTAVFSC